MSGHLGENLQLGFGQVWRTLEGGNGGHPVLEAGCHTSQTLSTGSIIYLIRHETHPGSTGSLGGQLGESDKGQGRNSLPFGPIQTERKCRYRKERTTPLLIETTLFCLPQALLVLFHAEKAIAHSWMPLTPGFFFNALSFPLQLQWSPALRWVPCKHPGGARESLHFRGYLLPCTRPWRIRMVGDRAVL